MYIAFFRCKIQSLELSQLNENFSASRQKNASLEQRVMEQSETWLNLKDEIQQQKQIKNTLRQQICKLEFQTKLGQEKLQNAAYQLLRSQKELAQSEEKKEKYKQLVKAQKENNFDSGLLKYLLKKGLDFASDKRYAMILMLILYQRERQSSETIQLIKQYVIQLDDIQLNELLQE